ncbi:MAG: nitrite reductase/ring-hydroxylating ferredoxin subunit [Myxococcota bacterium]|jgi:nitrite reductase/ring-hydroxylating ferredoxin subunit
MASEPVVAKLPPTPMERSPVPDLGTAPIPKERYVSSQYKALEDERLWPKVWHLAGVASDLNEAGAYLTYEIGEESVLVVRQTTGDIAAFYNVCTHRGNRLVEPGAGRAAGFTCLFHAWRFDVDGTLAEAVDSETFAQGCPASELSLRPVRCEQWGGFAWINLDADAEPLTDYLENIPEHLDPYHFEQMKILNEYTIEIPCNWKTSMDAFHESYHILGTHPDTLDVNDDVNCVYDCFDRHSRMILQLAVASPRHPEHGKVNDTIRDHFLASAGVDPATFQGSALDVRPAIAKAVREIQGPAMGADFSELNDAQLVDDFHYSIFPNITFNIFGRSAWLFRHRPHPTDPDKMYFDFFNLVRLPNADIPRPPREVCVASDDLLLEPVGGGGELLAQDTYNLPRIQKGMHSAGFSGLHLGNQEIRIRHFHHNLDRYIEGEGHNEN